MSSPTRPIGKIRMRDLNVILSSHLFPHIINREVNTHSISHHMNWLNNQVVYIYITRKRRSTIQNKTRTTSNATQQSGKGPISLTQAILEIKEGRNTRKQTSKGEVIRFSTASTTPSFVFNPIAVEPNCSNSNTPTHASRSPSTSSRKKKKTRSPTTAPVASSFPRH